MRLIKPDWPAPTNIQCFSTTRIGGVSKAPYQGLNLGLHVADEVDSVYENRRLLETFSGHPKATHWLKQTHSTIVVEYRNNKFSKEADGIFSWQANQPCVVMTADCLPVLLCSKSGDFVAALHAGWRGLAEGVLINGVAKYHTPENLLAWIGPAISQEFFEVGDEVRAYFVDKNVDFAKFFKAIPSGKYLADLAGIAEHQLSQLGVAAYQSEYCTYKDRGQFYSYRRDGQTGRMATMIWMETSE